MGYLPKIIKIDAGYQNKDYWSIWTPLPKNKKHLFGKYTKIENAEKALKKETQRIACTLVAEYKEA